MNICLDDLCELICVNELSSTPKITTFLKNPSFGKDQDEPATSSKSYPE